MLMYFIYLLTIRFYLLFVFGVSEVLVQTHLFFYQMACQCFSPDYFCKNGGFFIKMVKGYGRKNCQNGSCRPGKSVT